MTISHPEPESVRHSELDDEPRQSAGEVPHVDTQIAGQWNLCAICKKPLLRGDRKVHRAPCARKRKSQLQRLRRWRQRRWGRDDS